MGTVPGIRAGNRATAGTPLTRSACFSPGSVFILVLAGYCHHLSFGVSWWSSPMWLVFFLFLWMLSDFGRPPTSEYYVCDPGSYLISWKMLMFCFRVNLAGFSSPVLTRLLCVVVSGSFHLQEAFAVLPGLPRVPPGASVSLCGSCHCTSQSLDLLLGSDPRMHSLGGGEEFLTASGAGSLS